MLKHVCLTNSPNPKYSIHNDTIQNKAANPPHFLELDLAFFSESYPVELLTTRNAMKQCFCECVQEAGHNPANGLFMSYFTDQQLMALACKGM